MPDSYAESADGVVLIANGIDPVLRWDGFQAFAEPAGVPAPDPDTIPVLAATGSGSITGTYSCYVRWLDARGQPGNLSAVSVAVAVTAAGGFAYSNLPTAPGPEVVTRQILRNTAGQAATFYVDVEDTLVYDATATGTKTDGQLATSEAVVLIDPESGLPVAYRFGVPPDTKPFVATHLQRTWFWGTQPYAEGSAKVALGSATVTGIGTEWRENWTGRFLYVVGATRSYEIDSVDPDAQTLTLVEAYADATDPFAEYAIRPSPAEESLLYFSEPGSPEAVPFYNALSTPEDGDTPAGMLQFGSFLWLFKGQRTYRLTGQSDPLQDAFIFHALGRGVANHRCFAVVEEQLYALDERGVYRTGGGDQAENISAPIQNLFRPNSGGINWQASRYFHCVVDHPNEAVRWYVTFAGEYLPRHCLALHYPTGKWWVDDMPVSVGASCVARVGRPTGAWGGDAEAVLLGSTAGRVLVAGGPLDGPPAAGATNRGTVTAAGSDTLTDGGAAFDPLMVNVPVCIVSGRGKGQRRLVVAATATTLTVDEPWAVVPEAGQSEYQLGGIPFRFLSGRYRWAPDERNKGRAIEIQYHPTSAPQTFDLRMYADFAAVPRQIGRAVDDGQRFGVRAEKDAEGYTKLLSHDHGFYRQTFSGMREGSVESGRAFAIELVGVSGPEQTRFGEAILEGGVK
jgi:hypothetical protein